MADIDVGHNVFTMVAKVLILSGLKFIVTVLCLVVMCNRADCEPPMFVVKTKTASIYLYGAIHALSVENSWLSADVKKAFDSSDVLVTELPSKINLMTKLSVGFDFVFNKHESLEKRVSSKSFDKLKSIMRHGEISLLDNMGDSLVMVIVSSKMLESIGVQYSRGVDAVFVEMAKNTNKKHKALETHREQYNLMRSLPRTETASRLDETLKNYDQNIIETRAYIECWMKGDIKAFELLNEKSRNFYPLTYQIMLDDRNKKWLVQILKYLSGKKNTFVCVGAGHLVGENGLIELLTKHGFSVERVL